MNDLLESIDIAAMGEYKPSLKGTDRMNTYDISIKQKDYYLIISIIGFYNF